MPSQFLPKMIKNKIHDFQVQLHWMYNHDILYISFTPVGTLHGSDIPQMSIAKQRLVDFISTGINNPLLCYATNAMTFWTPISMAMHKRNSGKKLWFPDCRPQEQLQLQLQCQRESKL
jgi:hypothetical protein